MRLQLPLLAAIIVLILCGTMPAGAVPAYPHEVHYTQPDGTTVAYRVRGDESCHWIESTGGYLLERDSTGYIVYAVDDERPAGTSRIVYRGNDAEASLRHRLLRGMSGRYAAREEKVQRTNLATDGSFPTTGKRRLLMLLVNFADTKISVPAENFDWLMNQENYNGTGSFRDFYLENSYGQLDIETTVVGWITLPREKMQYGTEDMTQLIVDALSQVASTVNLSDFDNNGDGVLDGLSIIHQGMGAEVTGMTTDIWSHSAALLNVQVDGIRVKEYTIQPELLMPGQMTTVGVLCHEFGHNLGAPDYYDVDYEKNGLFNGTGIWDCMAEGIWSQQEVSGDSPTHINMWQKIQFGWVTPTILSDNCTVTDMPAASEAGVAYIMNTTVEGDYFVIENRQQAHFDRALPGHGLVVYHVDESRISASIGLNSINADYVQSVYTVCASAGTDPSYSPESYGDINSPSAPFPGTNGIFSFTDATLPSTHSNNGKFAYCGLSGISENNGLVSFDYVKEKTPAPVGNFEAKARRGIVTLSWTKPDEAGVAGYRVFRNGSFLAETRELSYTDNEFEGHTATYQVDVFYENGLYSPFVSAVVRVPQNRIASLTSETGESDVTLRWEMEPMLTRAETDFESLSTPLIVLGQTIDVAHRFTADDLRAYAGYSIQSISFIPFSSHQTTVYKVRVWRIAEGENIEDAEIVAESSVTEYGSGQWFERRLSEPVRIDPGYDYLVGFSGETSDGGLRLICDGAAAVIGYGNLVRVDSGEWEASLASNAMIEASLVVNDDDSQVFTEGEQPQFDADYDPATDIADYPIGFNVYRDDQLVGFTSSRTYVDRSVTTGQHTYGVVCLYEGNSESEPTERSLYCVVADIGTTDAGATKIWLEGKTVHAALVGEGSMTVYDVSGRTVAKVTASAGKCRTDILHAGVYVVSVKDGEHVVIRKLIIQ